jgi:hypothetical protein
MSDEERAADCKAMEAEYARVKREIELYANVPTKRLSAGCSSPTVFQP